MPDHVLPRSRGGTDDPDNLQILCFACNNAKGNRTNVEASKSVAHSSAAEQAGYTMLPNVVLLDRRLSLGARVTYGILKSYAWRDQSAWPGQARLATQLGVSEHTLRDYIRELADAELLYIRRRGRGLTNIYRVLPPRHKAADIADQEPPETSVLEAQEPSETSVVERKNETAEVNEVEEDEVELEQEATTLALTGEITAPDPLAQPSPTPRSMPRVVDRAAVTISEAGLAVKVLTAYNDLTGQAYASKEWLSKIVMRIREHPELGLDEHRSVLEVALADPWWKGRPTPSVVYGNAAQFERCLDAMLAEPLRNGNGAAPLPHMKFGRRDVSATEMLAAAERLEQRKEIERESG